MSYLDRPRLAFDGFFKADPSTLNNEISNYSHVVAANPELCHTLFNPYGKNYFTLRDCRVKSSSTPDGKVRRQQEDDLLVGLPVKFVPWEDGLPDGFYSTAKLVDLDPLNQTVSTLYGARIQVGDARVNVTGKLEPSGVRDAWFGRLPVAGDASASATWQTVLTDLKWSVEAESSPVLRLLRVGDPGQLSLKLTMDAFDADPNSPTFLIGRIRGCLGPFREGEPRQFVAERRLNPQIEAPPVGCGDAIMDPRSLLKPTDFWCWAASWKLDVEGRVAVIDLCNSLPFGADRNEPVVNQLFAAILPAAASDQLVLIESPVPTSADQLATFAGIVEVPLSEEQAELLQSRRLGLFVNRDDLRPVLAEHETGQYVNTDDVFARLNPGQQVDVALYARRFGQPLAGFEVDFSCETCSWTENANVPLEALFPSGGVLKTTTDESGRGTLTIVATDARLTNLPDARKPLDSQVYFLQGQWKEWGYLGWKLWTSTAPPGTADNPNVVGGGQQGGGVISVLVHNKRTIPDRPQWERDVEPVLRLYANLYPAMFAAMDLTDESLVRAFARRIHQVLTLPFDHPGYMPLTRDLSERNRLMICRWLSKACEEATGETLEKAE